MMHMFTIEIKTSSREDSKEIQPETLDVTAEELTHLIAEGLVKIRVYSTSTYKSIERKDLIKSLSLMYVTLDAPPMPHVVDMDEEEAG